VVEGNQNGALIELHQISVELDQALILSNVSFQLKPGEIVDVMGPNGAGKSTMLRAIVGEVEFNSGEVRFHGRSQRLRDHEVLERGICYVPQGRRVFSSMSVRENLELGCLSVRDRTVVRRRMEHVLFLFPDLKNSALKRAGDLSGGQQQMVALAGALMSSPRRFC
jgi:branched-chain amino acid transport system ATP-binding protein